MEEETPCHTLLLTTPRLTFNRGEASVLPIRIVSGQSHSQGLRFHICDYPGIMDWTQTAHSRSLT